MKKYYIYNDDIGTWSTKAYSAAEILAKYGKGKVTVLPITPDGIVEENCVLDLEKETMDTDNNSDREQEEESKHPENEENPPSKESEHVACEPHENFSDLSGLSPSLLYTATYRIRGQKPNEWGDPMSYSKAWWTCANNLNAVVSATVEGGVSYYGTISNFNNTIKAGKEQIFILPPVLLYTATYRIQGQLPGEWSEPMSYSKAWWTSANNPGAVVCATIEGGDSYYERFSSFTAAIKANDHNIRCINIALTVLFMIQGISSTLTITTLSGKLSEYHSSESRHILYMSFTAAIVLAVASVVGLIIAPGLNKKGEKSFMPLVVTVVISLIIALIGAGGR